MGCKRCGREWGVKGGGRRVEGKTVNAEETPGCHTRHVRVSNAHIRTGTQMLCSARETNICQSP